jgi:rhodanese-related sulfurtransferase
MSTVAGHIAGAKNVAPEPGSPPAAFIAAVERLVGGDKAKPLVLYCNGQYCRASRQLSEQLIDAGFTNVRRYQLGIPMWRALNGPCTNAETARQMLGSMKITRGSCRTSLQDEKRCCLRRSALG